MADSARCSITLMVWLCTSTRICESLLVGSDRARDRAGMFATLHDAFLYAQPSKSGFITDDFLFASAAAGLANGRGANEVALSHLDLDGNGAVSFAEFVEWAEKHDFGLAAGVGSGKTWSTPRFGPTRNGRRVITDEHLLSELQLLLDGTHKDIVTRDRKNVGHVGPDGRPQAPMRLELVRAEQNENEGDWQRYDLRRQFIQDHISLATGVRQYVPLTAKVSSLGSVRHGLRGNLNEWLLFHGTTSSAADSIAKGDFKISLAGSRHPGKMYGKGTYFADSSTKADEYCQEGLDGTCTVLLCRVFGGNVLYDDDFMPIPEMLQESAMSGGYHSVLGDREKVHRTYKEYVVFDADQIYVEYVLQYRRVYT